MAEQLSDGELSPEEATEPVPVDVMEGLARLVAAMNERENMLGQNPVDEALGTVEGARVRLWLRDRERRRWASS